MNIFLVGFMGSGKSTLGKKIAQQLNYKFIDTDKEIEIAQNNSIAQIFESQGELHFRQLELDWLKTYSAENTVIATGGGMPCFNENLKILQQKGKLVYLHLPAEVLADRLLQAKTSRPLIANFTDNREALINYINDTLNIRTTFYQQSDFTLSGLNLTSEKIKQLIELLLKSDSLNNQSLE